MTNYIIRRLILTIPLILGVSFVIFIILHSMPGDPAEVIAGLDGTEEVLQKIRKDLGLDKPILSQYGIFVRNIFLHGDLGYSFRSRKPVSEEIMRRFPNTFVLGVCGMFMAILIGVVSGIFSALGHNSAIDRCLSVLTLVGLSTPRFWLGLLCIMLFSVHFGWLPAGGMSGIDSYILPSFSLGLPAAATITRMVRASLLEVLSQNYIRTARAKGLSQTQVILRHGLRNALIPAVTIIGLQFGYLLGGSVVVETVFSWPGMGQLIIMGIIGRDYPMVQGAIMVMAFVFVFLNLFVDLLYSYLNPRIQYD